MHDLPTDINIYILVKDLVVEGIAINLWHVLVT